MIEDQGKFSYIFIDKKGLPANIYNECLNFLQPKVNILTKFDPKADLVICSSSNYLNNPCHKSFIIKDTSINDEKIKNKFFYNSDLENINFFKCWLEKSFRILNIPYLSEDHHQTILII